MAPAPRVSGRRLRLLVVGLAIAMVATVGLVAFPARAAFTSMSVAPGLYTGFNLYVPTENMQITITASAGDTYNLRIQNTGGSPVQTITNILIPSAGQATVTWTVPTTWADGFNYEVQALTTTNAVLDTYFFGIQQYYFNIATDRRAYLPGDTVTVLWAAIMIKDGTPAPNGVGQIQVYDNAFNPLLGSWYNFTSPQGSFAFATANTLGTNQRLRIWAGFNSTDGLRTGEATTRPWIYGLGEIVTLDSATYAPGGVVHAFIWTKATPNPLFPNFGDTPAPGVSVNITVTDLSTGNPVAAYGATNLLTDSAGYLEYVFQLQPTPTTGSYQLTATATAFGSNTATTSQGFAVASSSTLSVQLTLNKGQYLSGDVLTATATASSTSTTPVNFTYDWEVLNGATGYDLAFRAGGPASFTYNISTSYEGSIEVWVAVHDGLGNTAVAVETVQVAFGYLSLTLDKTEFNAGDAITASFSLLSNTGVMPNPTYFWEVADNGGNTVDSGSTTGGTATYQTPSVASTRYTFTVTASSNGRTAGASANAFLLRGFAMSVTLDKDSYVPGDTIHLTYSITPMGNVPMPLEFHVTAFLFGIGQTSAWTTSSTGTLSLYIPTNSPQGDVLLEVYDSGTGAESLTTVHVGAVNPLMVSVGGIPLISLLLTLLVIVLLLAVVLLWRRTGMGRGPRGPAPAPEAPSRPAPPPPPSSQPPSGSPMSVACKHCGANIEITTSKRPIEVMCPSCGETQVVQ